MRITYVTDCWGRKVNANTLRYEIEEGCGFTDKSDVIIYGRLGKFEIVLKHFRFPKTEDIEVIKIKTDGYISRVQRGDLRYW